MEELIRSLDWTTFSSFPAWEKHGVFLWMFATCRYKWLVPLQSCCSCCFQTNVSSKKLKMNPSSNNNPPISQGSQNKEAVDVFPTLWSRWRTKQTPFKVQEKVNLDQSFQSGGSVLFVRPASYTANSGLFEAETIGTRERTRLTRERTEASCLMFRFQMLRKALLSLLLRCLVGWVLAGFIWLTEG